MRLPRRADIGTVSKPVRVKIQVPVHQMATLLLALRMPWEPAIPTAWLPGGDLRPNANHPRPG
jgi:hypothetical protein